MKKHYKLNIAVALSLGGIITIPQLLLAQYEKQIYTVTKGDKERFGEYIQYFTTNDGFNKKGRPLRLDISDPIAIVMQDVEEQEKKHIVDAVNALQEICPNLDYRIYENQSTPLNTINISVQAMDEHKGGTTSYTYKVSEAQILYPIDIVLNEKYSDLYFDEKLTDSVLTGIAKHELLHTLGLKDLYEDEEYDKSIMYYCIKPDLVYTARDEEIIKYVYRDEVIATTYHPQQMLYFPTQSKHKETTEDELEMIN